MPPPLSQSVISGTIASEERFAPKVPLETDGLTSQTMQSQLADILGSISRLTDLQLRIWLTRMKMALLRVVLFAMLCLVAVLLVIVAIPFLYAGIYYVLTDLLLIPSPWALLIFAGGHLLIAGIAVLVAISILKRRDHPVRAIGAAQ